MYFTRNVTDDIVWIGANDRRIARFEGFYPTPRGMSYNSYLVKDEQTVLFDTADKAVSARFLENLAHELGGRKLDHIIVQHMEPDHSATLMQVLCIYPDADVYCSAKAAELISQFFCEDISARIKVIKEGDVLCSGKHEFHFIAAPMVHWPEVMVTYDSTSKTLFSADAFGMFGAINGLIFADEVDFYKDFIDEARRYYTNIVGKYGPQVQMLLKKASALDIDMICPLHGFVHRKNIEKYIEKYDLWSRYEPEEKGVMIAYASIYGDTENAAEVLSGILSSKGVKTEMYDTSVDHVSAVLSACFRYKTLVFAAPTYNMGVFVSMEDLLHDIVAHNLTNKRIAFIGNGSWAPVSPNVMKGILEPLKNVEYIGDPVVFRSNFKEDQLPQMEELADKIVAGL